MDKKALKRLLPLAMFLVGLLSLIAAVAVFVVAAGVAAAYRAVLLRIAGVLFLLLAGLAFYYIYISRETDPNFFLYDRVQHRNLTPDQLTFDIVDERMTFYLSLISKSDEELWRGDVLAKEDAAFGRGGVYRPLVAYKMLFDLTAVDDPACWAWLEAADASTIRLLTKALRQSKDNEMADAIVELYRGDNLEPGENLRDFLKGNQKYLRGRMLRYVKQNLESFY